MDLLIFIFFTAAVVAFLVVVGLKIARIIRKRNTPPTPEEIEAQRQRERDAQPTPQEIASRGRTNAIARECARVAEERRLIITSGSSQPLPPFPPEC